MSIQRLTASQPNGIDPNRLYPESELRKLLESQAIRKAKRAGLKSYRCGRTSWILGADLIRHIQGRPPQQFICCRRCGSWIKETAAGSGGRCDACWRAEHSDEVEPPPPG